MQIKTEHITVKKPIAYRAAQTISAVTLPFIDPLASYLVGQPILLKGKAKNLLATPLPHINSVCLNYKNISELLIKGIESGALLTKDVQLIINGFDDKTIANEVIHNINVKIRNHAIADKINIITQNCADIYDEVHSLGYQTDTLNIADIVYEESILMIEFSEALSVYIYEDQNLPYDIQLCICAVAHYFGLLCGASPADHFAHYSEDFEIINEVNRSHSKALLAIEDTLSDREYINEFKRVMPTDKFDEYVDILESYYSYSLEEEEHHYDIAQMIKESLNTLRFVNQTHFNSDNYYQIKNSNKLLSRINRIIKRYENTTFYALITKISTLFNIAHNYRNIYATKFDFDFAGDVSCLSYFQVITFRSIENDFMWKAFSDSENQIMEMGDYVQIITDLNDLSFLSALKNHQLGWLLGHCLNQSLSEYQNNV